MSRIIVLQKYPAQTRFVFTSEVKDTVEQLVGHERMGQLPEESLEEDSGGVDILLLEVDRLSSVDFLDELLDVGGTGRSPVG